MKTLTIRKVSDATDRAIRIEAARLGLSKEAYVRRILDKLADQIEGVKDGPSATVSNSPVKPPRTDGHARETSNRQELGMQPTGASILT